MAQKRMFDRAIIDTDRFMDLGMTAKAFYFLLGMEADDEGFVSYKKVMRIHGGNEDDMKVLTAKGFILHFPSGVVVITDWNTNNYLDKNRLKPTEYQKEKEMLSLTTNGKYELNNRLTRGVESSIEHIGELGIRVVPDSEKEEKPEREKKDTTYLKVFDLFPEKQLNWRKNTTEIAAAKNLLAEQEFEDIKSALAYYLKHKNDDWIPEILTPSDLDRKWLKLEAFYNKKHG